MRQNMGVVIHGFRPNRALEPMLQDMREKYLAMHDIILIVPEHYTLIAQKEVLNALGNIGFFNIQILTPKYLSTLILEKSISENTTYISTSGEAILLTQIIENLSDSLLFYKDGAEKSAQTEILSFLHDLQSHELSAAQIENYANELPHSILRQKWQDIVLIYSKYLELFNGAYINSVLEPDAVAKSIISLQEYKDAQVYVFGFDQLIKPLRTILLAIAQVAECVQLYINLQDNTVWDFPLYLPMQKSIEHLIEAMQQKNIPYIVQYRTVALPCASAIQHIDEALYSPVFKQYTEKHNAVTLFDGDSPFDEIEYVCAKIEELYKQGVSLEKMAVLIPESNDYSFILYTKLLHMGFNFYNHEEFAIAQHPFIKYMIALLRYLSDKNSEENLNTLLHNPFGSLSTEEKSYLKKYCYQNGIEAYHWLKNFTRSTKKVEKAETLRSKWITPLLELETKLLTSNDFTELISYLVDFLSDNGAYEKLNETEQLLHKYSLFDSASFSHQLWTNINTVLRELTFILENKCIPLAQLADYLQLAFNEINVVALPPIKNSLAISTIQRVLLSNIDYVFILGFNDGVLNTNEHGLFNANEISEFEYSVNTIIKISKEDLDNKNKQHVKKALTLPRKQLYLCYSKTDFDGASIWPFSVLSDMQNHYFAHLNYDTFIKNKGLYESENFQALKNNLQNYFIYENKDKTKENIINIINNLYSLGLNEDEIIKKLFPNSDVHIESKTAKTLFKTNTMSVSRLEQFAKCPYKHFIDYGIKPDKNEKWEPRSSDTGTFFHYVLEQFFNQYKDNQKLGQLNEQELEQEIENFINSADLFQQEGPYNDTVVNQSVLLLLKQEIKNACKVLVAQKLSSKFNVHSTEYRFDEKRTDPFVLQLNDGTNIALRGSIDRLDVYAGENNDFLRIIDYKSGNKKFNASELWYGSQLQLMLYLNVALQHFKNNKPSGAFYFHIDNPWFSMYSANNDEIQKIRLRESKLNGIVLKNKESVLALDINQNPVSILKALNKDGEFAKQALLFEEDELLALITHCVEKAKEFAEQINQGKIDVYPLNVEDHLPCEYCEYKNICRVENESNEIEKIDFDELKNRL